mmetsp:Transcript_87079/g.254836  ORF Transcript_87079/g.254836 Transcript_87079/m.254836 type:complete len:276 (-) Transcript_87079:143-970(-)
MSNANEGITDLIHRLDVIRTRRPDQVCRQERHGMRIALQGDAGESVHRNAPHRLARVIQLCPQGPEHALRALASNLRKCVDNSVPHVFVFVVQASNEGINGTVIAFSGHLFQGLRRSALGVLIAAAEIGVRILHQHNKGKCRHRLTEGRGQHVLVRQILGVEQQPLARRGNPPLLRDLPLQVLDKSYIGRLNFQLKSVAAEPAYQDPERCLRSLGRAIFLRSCAHGGLRWLQSLGVSCWFRARGLLLARGLRFARGLCFARGRVFSKWRGIHTTQ